jgi:hypothetical protein
MAVSLFAVHAMAQKTTTDTTAKKKQTWANAILGDHSDDHFMFQLGFSDFLNKNDSISTKGIGRSFNAYFMKSFHFKNNDRFAFALGLGFGTDNYYLNKELVDLKNPTRIVFLRDTIDQYRRSKITAAFVEVPAEIRYNANPDNLNSSWKFALGVKLGALLSVHTKVKYTRDIENNIDYTAKEKDNRMFNPVRAAGYFRFGYGVWSLFMQVTMTSFIKIGDGPPIIPYTAGIAISGL